MPDSSHTKGQSFDIDGCGYYENDNVVNPRQTANYYDIYNPLIMRALKETLEEMKKKII